MEKRTAHTLAGGLAVLVIGGLFWSNLRLERRVEELRGQLGSAENRVTMEVNQVQDQMNGVYNRVEELLTAKASLLSRVETTLEYEDGQLALAVSVVPKEVRDGEALSVVSQEVEVPLQAQPGQEAYSARLPLPLTDEINATVIFRAQDSTRREALPTLYAREILELNYQTQWDSFNQGDPYQEGFLYVGLEPNPILGRAAALECVIVDQIIGTEVARVAMTPSKAGGPGSGWSWYEADLSAYGDQQGEYNVFVEADTGGGLRFTDRSPSASFHRNADGTIGGRSSGSGGLYPDFLRED